MLSYTPFTFKVRLILSDNGIIFTPQVAEHMFCEFRKMMLGTKPRKGTPTKNYIMAQAPLPPAPFFRSQFDKSYAEFSLFCSMLDQRKSYKIFQIQANTYNSINMGVQGSVGGHLGPKSSQALDFINFWLDFKVHFGSKIYKKSIDFLISFSTLIFDGFWIDFEPLFGGFSSLKVNPRIR